MFDSCYLKHSHLALCTGLLLCRGPWHIQHDGRHQHVCHCHRLCPWLLSQCADAGGFLLRFFIFFLYFFFFLLIPHSELRITTLVGFCIFDHWATIQIFTFWLLVYVVFFIISLWNLYHITALFFFLALISILCSTSFYCKDFNHQCRRHYFPFQYMLHFGYCF